MAEWFWVWCHLSSISTVFEATFSYYSIMAFLKNFRGFRVFAFGPQIENPEITENLCFWVYKNQMHMNLFFHNCFNFLSPETKINKNMLNLINLDGFEAFKRQTPGTWLEICVNHFEFDVIWRTSQLLLKLHSHNSVLWRFCNISLLSEFSYLGVGLKMKTQKSRKILILLFFFFFLKRYQIRFCVFLSLFLWPEFLIFLFSYYFCDFRGFRDFRVFDLAP